MNAGHRVLLVDDHALVRRGMAALLATDARFQVVGEAGNGEVAVQQVLALRPDIVILDLSMPRVDGLEALRRIRKGPCRPRILVLSMHDDPQVVAQALADGADGYLLKDAMDDELFQALSAILHGQRFIASQINRGKLEAAAPRAVELTAREREVLQLLADGRTTQQAADLLAISPHTATRHRANLMQKLGVHNQAELVRVAMQRGLILVPPSRVPERVGG